MVAISIVLLSMLPVMLICSNTVLLHIQFNLLTYDIYGIVLLWKHPNTILTHNQCTIEVCSSIDCCSGCNRSRHHLCDSKLKWTVRDHSTEVTRKKRLSDVKGRDPPLMSNRQNGTCECHTLPRTGSFHTGLQLST